MRLTLRDGAATALAALAVLVTLAVTQGWAWPLLGGYRAGILALTLTGIAMCATGAGAVAGSTMKEPLAVIVSVLGVAALVLIVLGLVAGTQTPFVGLAAVLVAMWFFTTVHHAVGATGSGVATGA